MQAYLRYMMKQWVQENCLRKDGRMTSWCGNNKWWSTRSLGSKLDELYAATAFLLPSDPIAARLYCVLNDIQEAPKCLTCSGLIGWKNGYDRYCCHTCVTTNDELNTRRITRSRETMKKRYGVINPSSLQEVRDKIGDAHRGKKKKPFTIGEHFSQKHFTTDQIHLLQDPQLLMREHIDQKIPLTLLSEKYGFSTAFLHKFFNKHNLEYVVFGNKSFIQREIEAFIENTGHSITANNRKVIPPLELDIVVQDKKVAIEVNGLFWHNDKIVDKTYHNVKTEKCREAKIRLLHIFDVEWIDKKEICSSIIAAAIGSTSRRLNARDLVIHRIDSRTASLFLESNHIQGSTNHQTAYGGYLSHELVCVMTFGAPRFDKEHKWELIRYASLLNTSVRGGPSRLFKRFLDEHKPSSVVTYSDNRLFEGGMYRIMGFEEVYQTPLNYYYFTVKEYKLRNRMQFQKHRLKDKLATFDSAKTEYDNMSDNGWYRIWDCGNTKWVWKKSLT